MSTFYSRLALRFCGKRLHWNVIQVELVGVSQTSKHFRLHFYIWDWPKLASISRGCDVIVTAVYKEVVVSRSSVSTLYKQRTKWAYLLLSFYYS
jgi:hypothetical protein